MQGILKTTLLDENIKRQVEIENPVKNGDYYSVEVYGYFGRAEDQQKNIFENSDIKRYDDKKLIFKGSPHQQHRRKISD